MPTRPRALRLALGDVTVDGEPMDGLTGALRFDDVSGTSESTSRRTCGARPRASPPAR